MFIVHHLERDLAVLAPALGDEVAELGHRLCFSCVDGVSRRPAVAGCVELLAAKRVHGVESADTRSPTSAE